MVEAAGKEVKKAKKEKEYSDETSSYDENEEDDNGNYEMPEWEKEGFTKAEWDDIQNNKLETAADIEAFEKKCQEEDDLAELEAE